MVGVRGIRNVCRYEWQMGAIEVQTSSLSSQMHMSSSVRSVKSNVNTGVKCGPSQSTFDASLLGMQTR